MATKCNEKCEVYSRVCGYFRPVSNWQGEKEIRQIGFIRLIGGK